MAWNYDNVGNGLIKLCTELNRIPMIKEFKSYDFVPTDHHIVRKLMNENGYLNYHMFCIDNGFIPHRWKHSFLTYNILCKLFDNFYNKYNFIPTRDELYKRKYNELPDFHIIRKVCGDKINEFCDKYHAKKKYDYYYTESFEFYCNKFKDLYIQNPNTRNIFGNNGIPHFQWFVLRCPVKITYINEFIDYLDLIPSKNMSKDQAIKLIFEVKDNLNRNLKYSDFKNNKRISPSIINKYWGTFNNMLLDLGFDINQGNMVAIGNEINLDILCEDLKLKCKFYIDDNNINIINLRELDKYLQYDINTYVKHIKKELHLTLGEYIQSLGYKVIEAGRGLNYIFDDGEKILSQYEFIFSNFLRNRLNLKYNIDYNKDIRYRNFIKECKNYCSIDYIINYKNIIIYVEIAGMLRDYKQFYLDDEPIGSKSKERYKIKLKEKERTLKDNNLEYYILFPQDLTEDFLLGIFN